MNQITVIRLGLMPYQAAWDLQERLLLSRQRGTTGDTLLLVEHPHTYTFGKTSHKENMLLSADDLARREISVFDINRGGDVTYHGFGQLVAYPILDLHNYYLDLHRYLRDLEETVIQTLADFGIAAHRKVAVQKKDNFTGVWVNSAIGNETREEKICAIGIRTSRWVTMHGLALNVSPDLSYFDGIVPCGIGDYSVTSMQKRLGRKIETDVVIEKFIPNFGKIFKATINS
jgi:lipoyl(octanoyl) transferase